MNTWNKSIRVAEGNAFSSVGVDTDQRSWSELCSVRTPDNRLEKWNSL